MSDEFILPQDIQALRDATMQAKLALATEEVTRLRLFVRYGLSERDSFDLQTGKITRAASSDPGV